MNSEEYNYSAFVMNREQPGIDGFSEVPLRPGGRAPSFPLEDLESGGSVEMNELWRDNLAVIEFGSFT